MLFSDVLKTAESEGREKHVPVIEVDGDRVRVLVGKEVPHPNLIEHHIVWLELYGVKPDGQVIALGRADFAPTFSEPNAVFQVKIDQFRSLLSVSYCNIHGVWQNGLDL